MVTTPAAASINNPKLFFLLIERVEFAASPTKYANLCLQPPFPPTLDALPPYYQRSLYFPLQRKR